MELLTSCMIIIIGICISILGYLIKRIIQKSNSHSFMINRHIIPGLIMIIYMIYCTCYKNIDIIKDFSTTKYEILALTICSIVIVALESQLYEKYNVSYIGPFIILSALLSSIIMEMCIYNETISRNNYLAYILIITGLIVLSFDK